MELKEHVEYISCYIVINEWTLNILLHNSHELKQSSYTL